MRGAQIRGVRKLYIDASDFKTTRVNIFNERTTFTDFTLQFNEIVGLFAFELSLIFAKGTWVSYSYSIIVNLTFYRAPAGNIHIIPLQIIYLTYYNKQKISDT